MPGLFCPRCGNEVSENNISGDAGSICMECYAEEIKPLTAPDRVHLEICTECGSYLIDHEWLSSEEPHPEEELASIAAENELRIHRDVSEPSIQVMVEKLDGNTYVSTFEVHGLVDGIQVRGTIEISVDVKRVQCPTCLGMRNGYYESIVQIRADNRDPTEEELRRAEEIAYSLASKDLSDRDTYVSRKEERDGGIDLYLSSTSMGRDVARRISSEFGGSFSDSATLVGQSDGTDVNRVTYSVRLPCFVEGDVVSDGETAILINKTADSLKGIDLDTGESVTVKPEIFNKITKESSAVQTNVVSCSDGEVQLIDPETYETVTIQRPQHLDLIGKDSVHVVKTPMGLKILPISTIE